VLPETATTLQSKAIRGHDSSGRYSELWLIQLLDGELRNVTQ
jgi:hypothetical protein